MTSLETQIRSLTVGSTIKVERLAVYANATPSKGQETIKTITSIKQLDNTDSVLIGWGKGLDTRFHRLCLNDWACGSMSGTHAMKPTRYQIIEVI